MLKMVAGQINGIIYHKSPKVKSQQFQRTFNGNTIDTGHRGRGNRVNLQFLFTLVLSAPAEEQCFWVFTRILGRGGLHRLLEL